MKARTATQGAGAAAHPPRRRHLSRSTAVSLIDVIAFLGFVALTSTGVVLHYLLPPGSGRWTSLWGLSRHQWGAIHFWVSVVFFAVLALHLFLHWRFIAGLLRGRVRQGGGLRFALGVVGLVAVVLLALAPLLTPVQTSPDGGGAHQRGKRSHAAAPGAAGSPDGVAAPAAAGR